MQLFANNVGGGENAGGKQHFLLSPLLFGVRVNPFPATNFRLVQIKGFADNNFKYD